MPEIVYEAFRTEDGKADADRLAVALLDLSISWAGEYHYCRGVSDAQGEELLRLRE